MDEKICADAARVGDLDVVIAEIQKGVKLTEWTSSMACASGNMELLEYLLDRIVWNPWMCAMAARYGHMDVLIWCREHKCPWDAETCANAARGNHLHILKYARSMNCPWDSRTHNYARHYHRDSEMFEWIRDNKAPMDKNDTGIECTCDDCSAIS